MKTLTLFLLIAVTIAVADDRPRLLVTTDIGGDPDDQQSLIRLMVYANQFEIEGLVASASGVPGELDHAITRPDLIREIVEAYGEARPRLQRYEADWPMAETLLAVTTSGNPQRGLDHIGEAHDTEGSRWIIRRVDAGTPTRPLNISIWGGQTDFAQALWRVKTDRGTTGLAAFVQKLRVFDIADQDGIATWIHAQFPGLFYVLSKSPPDTDRRKASFRGMYLTGDEELTSHAWIEKHILSASPLGALYPTKTWTKPNPHACMKEGDTPSWFFFLRLGGNDPAAPSLPGWGGRYERGANGWYHDFPATADADPRLNVSRWRPEFQADFAQRMGWTRRN